MKKLGLLFRETSERRIKNNLKEANGIFIVRYSGVSSSDLNTLRRSLKAAHANLFVIKNNVARRALKNSNLENITELVKEPCALVFVKEEPINTCRVLYTFSREHEQLKLAGGLLEDRVIEEKEMQVLAKLPSKDVLRTQLVIALNSPILKLAVVLKQSLRKIVYCLEQIKNKKGG